MEGAGLSTPPAVAAEEAFFTAEWIDAWRAAYRAAGDPSAPWVTRRAGPLRILGLPGGAVSDYKALPEPAFAACARPWDALELVDVRPDDAAIEALIDRARLDGATVRTFASHRCPALRLRGSWEAWWRSRPKKTRYNVETAARKLAAAAGPLAVATCDAVADLPEYFAVARTLYARSRAGRMDTGEFLTPAGRRFFESWARTALARGWLDFCVLRAGATPVAFAFGFTCGAKYYYHVPGYDPAFARWSPGTLLLVRLIERAHRRGLAEIDLLKGDEPYKLRWSNTVRTLRVVLIARPGARGRLAGATLATFHAARRRLRTSSAVRAVLDRVVPRVRAPRVAEDA